MAQKKQDLKPDTVLKNYWRNNDRFADFFNAVLFEGRQVIKPEELEDIDRNLPYWNIENLPKVFRRPGTI
jgi:hypothetical protein